jgi:putative DNA methylase
VEKIMQTAKKLIEVALPLDAINAASAREKSIRHGHPSTLHLWWARRPLAAARAVIFAQMVDDPSAHPDLFPTEEAVETERQRLFRIIEQLVIWENSNNENVLSQARAEILRSWQRTCAANQDHPQALELFNPEQLPAFHDPFAGGGALPLEAQRLGLESYASDLNPVPVLINKAMIEIPPKFANMPPVNPAARQGQMQFAGDWQGAKGLAEDVRYYGQWMREQAEQRIGQLYPKVSITAEMVQERPDLKPYQGQALTVIAWLWARTVKSPNPAYAHVDVPLASSFMLSTKAGKEAFVEPVIEGDTYHFTVKVGKPADPETAKNGTKLARGANFRCLISEMPIEGDYIKAEGVAGRMGARLMAIVAEGKGGRVYLSPNAEHEQIAKQAQSEWRPETPLPNDPRNFWTVHYGLTTFGDLFTSRQLVALNTFADLVAEAREKIYEDALNSGLASAVQALDIDGYYAQDYADAVSIYLSLGISKLADSGNALVSWKSSMDQAIHLFTRQAIPMVWDYAEPNIFANAMGDLFVTLKNIARVIEQLPTTRQGYVRQEDAQKQIISEHKLVSTDPPYYDNVGYAELSDFFYVWLRRTLRPVFPELFATVATPKEQELVATPYRHGGKQQAEEFFLTGMTQAMQRLAQQAHSAFPVTIYYAFKQSETDAKDGTASTGWETFLAAVIQAGFAITGTWPMRTELGNRMIGMGTNALASSIVLVCRARTQAAPITTRRDFIAALKAELPPALRAMQKGNIAPVDLAQAAIGPGIAVYSRYSKVIDASGNALSVRDALALINQILDEVLAEQEGDFDADTRWALAWFEQYGFDYADYGIAETLSKAKNTSINGMIEAQIIKAGQGKVTLIKPENLDPDWNPHADSRLTIWEMVHQLIRSLAQGEQAAADLLRKLGSQAETARELAYRLYTICERSKRAQEALAYNGLVQSWPEIQKLAENKPSIQVQGSLF